MCAFCYFPRCNFAAPHLWLASIVWAGGGDEPALQSKQAGKQTAAPLAGSQTQFAIKINFLGGSHQTRVYGAVKIVIYERFLRLSFFVTAATIAFARAWLTLSLSNRSGSAGANVENVILGPAIKHSFNFLLFPSAATHSTAWIYVFLSVTNK